MQFIMEHNSDRYGKEAKKCLCKNYVSLITTAINRPIQCLSSPCSLPGAKKGINRYTFSGNILTAADDNDFPCKGPFSFL